jgi:hypothetical protein
MSITRYHVAAVDDPLRTNGALGTFGVHEFRAFLARYEVEDDERYVWD